MCTDLLQGVAEWQTQMWRDDGRLQSNAEIELNHIYF